MPSPKFKESVENAIKNSDFSDIDQEKVGSTYVSDLEEIQPFAKKIADKIETLGNAITSYPHLIDESQFQNLLNDYNRSTAALKRFNHREQTQNDFDAFKKQFFETVKALSPKLDDVISILGGAELDAVVAEYKQATNAIQDELATLKNQANAERTFLEKESIEKYWGIFNESAKSWFKAAIIWLLLSLVTAIGIGGYLYSQSDKLLSLQRSVLSQAQNPNANGVGHMPHWSYYVNKYAIVFLSITVMLFFAKNYRTSMHHNTINKQRADALKTFRAFVEQVQDDPEIRNAITLETTRFIFSTLPTGFTSEKTGPDAASQIIEITKSLKQTG